MLTFRYCGGGDEIVKEIIAPGAIERVAIIEAVKRRTPTVVKVPLAPDLMPGDLFELSEAGFSVSGIVRSVEHTIDTATAFTRIEVVPHGCQA